MLIPAASKLNFRNHPQQKARARPAVHNTTGSVGKVAPKEMSLRAPALSRAGPRRSFAQHATAWIHPHEFHHAGAETGAAL